MRLFLLVYARGPVTAFPAQAHSERPSAVIVNSPALILDVLLTPIDTCLVEIARRDCNSEPNHRLQLLTKPSGDTLDDSALPSPADEEPCESHYLKAKEAYSGILENIGCICRVLLSLNLDSCCVVPPDGSLRFKRSTGSMRKGLLTGTSMPSSAPSLCKSQEGIDGSKKPCCSEASTAGQETSPPPGLKFTGARKVSCFSGPSNSRIDRYRGSSAPSLDGSYKASADAWATYAAAPDDLSLKGGFCSSKEMTGGYCADNFGSAIPLPTPGDCSRKKCCSDTTSKPTTGQTTTEAHGDPLDSCYAKEYSTGADGDAIDSYCTSDPHSQLGTLAGGKGTRYTPVTGVNEFDLEKGDFPVEHVVLSVQGMTCTRCEKKLYKSLDMMAEISNIKTSLLLAQAEFDLSRTSATIDTLDTIKAIEKMTGFTCTTMTQSGHELDLIVDGLASEFAARDLPFRVSDIAVLDTHTIRVTY